ncbi:hypothetical protein [Catenuloplanes atrovinosus]|uniref:Type VII secretion protein EccE n=1 Tax=Catenuloplanes atrovinosus TaxID=137266 RepID=A0AAE3YWS8_9ACTN|nr:hypothetical protein [Catenuloplanes atrovinosus]MDR7279684.1 hypothetical protein [Catenuloplanes atrovinosus]
MAASARTARVLATELAVAAVLAAAAGGPVAAAAAVPVAAGVIAAAWVRVRGRHLHEWPGVALRYRRARPPAALTGPLVTVPLPPPPSRLPHEHERSPDVDGPTPEAMEDEHGLTVVLELGEPDAPIAPEPSPLPHPAAFRTAHAHVQLVVSVEPALAPAYRAMTDVPARLRALLAVRVPHRPGRDALRDLHNALRSVRTVLGDLPHRPLDGAELRRTLQDLAGTDGPVTQTWRHLRTPHHVHTMLRVTGDRPPVAALARLPAGRVTLAMTPAGTLLHVAAPAETHVPGARPLDGEHLAALTAALPLARDPHASPRTDRRPVEVPRDGLFLGRDRAGEPVVIRPFRRTAPVTIALVGGVRGAHLLTLRALASGAVVVVRTGRPRAWAPLLRAADPTGTVARLTGDAVDHPGRVLEVLDHAAGPGPYRHSRLLVLDELTPETAAAAARADLVLLQQLPAGHAEVAERHLGLGRAAGWLTRVRPGMVAVVVDRSLRWADPSPTVTERQLLDHASA